MNNYRELIAHAVARVVLFEHLGLISTEGFADTWNMKSVIARVQIRGVIDKLKWE